MKRIERINFSWITVPPLQKYMNPLNPPNPRLKNDLCNSRNLRSNHPAQSMNTIGCVPDSGLRQRQAPRSPSAATPPNPLKMSVTHPLGPQYHGARSAVPRSTVRSTTEHGPQCHGARPAMSRALPPPPSSHWSA